MPQPLVSVCIPCLNTRPYLQERVDSILKQTYQNFEILVVDSFSDDGTWEFFQELAGKDPRVSARQAPRGLYASWNRCLDMVRGDYVYFATSDDTMALDCFEKLVSALEEYRQCDLAHCNLVLIDETGRQLPTPDWYGSAAVTLGMPELMRQKHIRQAPFDGLLHLRGKMVNHSITELLIRRSLFDRVGRFSDEWGSVGDFFWHLKACLVASTVHVPDTWGGWRIYPTQATAGVKFNSPEHARKVADMICAAFATVEPILEPAVASEIRNHWIPVANEMRTYYWELRNRNSSLDRRVYQASQLAKGAVRREVLSRLTEKERWLDRAPSEFRDWMQALGIGPAISVLS